VFALWLRKRLGNPTLETSLVLLLPFTAFLAAEEAHASGILAVVVCAFSVSVNLTLDPKHQYPGAYRTRVQEEAIWPVVDFLLETFVFAYIGLQLKFVLEDLADSEEPGLVRTLIAAGVLLVAAIVIRLAVVQGLFGRWTLKMLITRRRLKTDSRFREAYERRQERNRQRGGQPLDPPTPKETFLVGWTGMRGILTLAAAAAVPEKTASGELFPGRDAIQAIALIVTLGTLLIQGTTIAWLARLLKFDLSGERAAEEKLREHGREIVARTAAEPSAGLDDSFEKQRLALGKAVADHDLTEDVARELIEGIDLRQAAWHTAPPANA
jgi:CPA1 family monovalent cation:H+ antiporter